jgi:hypothetical protein
MQRRMEVWTVVDAVTWRVAFPQALGINLLHGPWSWWQSTLHDPSARGRQGRQG